MLRAEAINHVSIPVNDLERAKKFYIEMLGMKELPRDPGGGRPEFSVNRRLGLPPTPLSRLECGGMEVTLFQRAEPADRDRLQELGGFHYSFRMNWDELNRLAQNLGELRKAGYNIPCEPIYRMVPGNENMSLYVIDPEGNLFELVGRPEGSSWRTPGGPGASENASAER